MFDWLTDGIISFIISVYDDLTGNIEALTALAQISPSQFNPDLWDLVIRFNTNAVLPVAQMIFGCFILSDFVKILNRQNASGLESIHMIFVIIFKLAIGHGLLANIPYLIDGIFDIASHIIASSNFTVADININPSELSDALENESTLTLISMVIQGTVIKIGNALCNIMARLIIQLRFIEIYAFVAVAALPIAVITSSNREVSVIGYGFIKRLCALALQVIFIMIVFMAYTAMVNADAFTVTDSTVDIAMWNYLGYSILLVIALFQTGTWSKALFQVH